MANQRQADTKESVDYVLLILVLILAVFGLVILYSTSAYNGRVKFADPAYYFKKQLFASSIGLMAMYLVSQIDYHIWIRAAVPGYLLSLLLSTAVLFVGQEYNGSKRWLALGLLMASGQLPPDCLADTYIAGELSLSGALRPVSGVLPLAILARRTGARRCIVPPANGQEAAVVQGMSVYAPRTLTECVAFLQGETRLEPLTPDADHSISSIYADERITVCGAEYVSARTEIDGSRLVKASSAPVSRTPAPLQRTSAMPAPPVP